MVRSLLKIVLSARLIEILDKDKNGKVTWKELKSATYNDWLEISFELGQSVISVLFLKGI